jgi:hypothetical protein
MLRILHESEENFFEGIATGDEFWSQYSYPSSKIQARSRTDVIPTARQVIEAKQTMITIFFTGHKLIILDISPKGSKFNQRYLVDCIFPDLERENWNFHRRIPQATFWVHMENPMCPNGSKVASKFEKHRVSRLPTHPIRQTQDSATSGSLEC